MPLVFVPVCPHSVNKQQDLKKSPSAQRMDNLQHGRRLGRAVSWRGSPHQGRTGCRIGTSVLPFMAVLRTNKSCTKDSEILH